VNENLVDEEAIARAGLQSQRKLYTGIYIYIRESTLNKPEGPEGG
jgi:hypothetical protein